MAKKKKAVYASRRMRRAMGSRRGGTAISPSAPGIPPTLIGVNKRTGKVVGFVTGPRRGILVLRFDYRDSVETIVREAMKVGIMIGKKLAGGKNGKGARCQSGKRTCKK